VKKVSSSRKKMLVAAAGSLAVLPLVSKKSDASDYQRKRPEASGQPRVRKARGIVERGS
jgi:hypothetical protein